MVQALGTDRRLMVDETKSSVSSVQKNQLGLDSPDLVVVQTTICLITYEETCELVFLQKKMIARIGIHINMNMHLAEPVCQTQRCYKFELSRWWKRVLYSGEMISDKLYILT